MKLSELRARMCSVAVGCRCSSRQLVQCRISGAQKLGRFVTSTASMVGERATGAAGVAASGEITAADAAAAVGDINRFSVRENLIVAGVINQSIAVVIFGDGFANDVVTVEVLVEGCFMAKFHHLLA